MSSDQTTSDQKTPTISEVAFNTTLGAIRRLYRDFDGEIDEVSNQTKAEHDAIIAESISRLGQMNSALDERNAARACAVLSFVSNKLAEIRMSLNNGCFDCCPALNQLFVEAKEKMVDHREN